MTPDSIAALEATLTEHVARHDRAGAATLAWRPGHPIRMVAFGRRDLESNQPVTRETIFRIASLTKPVTTVAALTLLDEGRFALDEPITPHAPELANLRVLVAPDGPLDRTRPAARPITFGDLLTTVRA